MPPASRVSELIGLNVEDVNLSAGFIRCASKGKERIVPLYATAVKALEDYVRTSVPASSPMTGSVRCS